jgi:hypothetical protein
VRFRTPAGSVEFALIDWKYTELYGAPDPFDSSNAERMRRYENIAFHPDGPLRADCGIKLVEFFAEPIYQPLRQQMLGAQMEKFQELGAKRVRTVLVAPSGNVALRKLKINACCNLAGIKGTRTLVSRGMAMDPWTRMRWQ